MPDKKGYSFLSIGHFLMFFSAKYIVHGERRLTSFNCGHHIHCTVIAAVAAVGLEVGEGGGAGERGQSLS